MVKGSNAEIRRLKTVPLWVSRQRASAYIFRLPIYKFAA
jgi:hypothetical protein